MPRLITLVTGATGFIGRQLVDSLIANGRTVRVLVRTKSIDGAKARWSERVQIVAGDLSDPDSLRGACDNVQSVFHLAGYAHAEDADDQRSLYVHERVTVDGTRALLAEAGTAGASVFVFASSVKALGEGGEQCIDEDATPAPKTVYGTAKYRAEQLVLGQNSRSMRAAVLRLPLVYGSGVKGNLEKMIRAIDRGRFPPPPNLNNRRSMVHVDDVVSALQLLEARPEAAGRVYTVTDGQPYSTYGIYARIMSALERPLPSWHVPMLIYRIAAVLGDVIAQLARIRTVFGSAALEKLFGSACYRGERITAELGFKPTESLDSALPRMIKAYRKENP